MTTPLRWGILGTGGIASAFVTDVRLLDHHTVIAVGSRTLSGGAEFGARHQIPRSHASYAALCADPEVDAIYVATPHPWHREHALLAIAGGKSVLVEKPFAMNAAEAQQVVDAAQAAGVLLMEAMWTRYLPHMVEIRRLVRDGAVGEIVSVVADHGQWFEPDPAFRLLAPELGGGALLDLGVYPVSFVHDLLGEPDSVVASRVAAFTHPSVDAQTSAVLGYASGAHGVITTTLLARSDTRGVINGTDGCIVIDPHFYRPTSFTLTRRDGADVRWDQPHQGHGLRHQAEHLRQCRIEGATQSPLLTHDQIVAVMRTLDRIAEAAGAPPRP